AAWLRWRWLQTSDRRGTQVKRRRCRWAYISFLLTVVTLLGLLASLSALALRAIVDLNVLVISAMAFFLVSVLALLVALGLWFWDVCGGMAMTPGRRHRHPSAVHPTAVALLPASMAVGVPPRRRRRRARR
ncbi:MAG: hypothetical protein AAF959_23760, partial [Cyanobacteria bacterium P01_D01_bin.56]